MALASILQGCSTTHTAGPVGLGSPAAATAAPASVLPGDDFFAYVNGAWLDKTGIPPDRSRWGAGAALAEDTNLRTARLIEAAAADAGAPPEVRNIQTFYAAYLDETAIDAKGLAPLRAALSSIAAIRDRTALAHALGAAMRADVDALNATHFFTENLFGLWVVQDLDDPAHHVPYLLQGGLGMPDRAYYVDAGQRMAALRAAYVNHVAATLALAGFSDSTARAARIVALEQQIAQSHASRADSADVQKAHNRWSPADFRNKAPGLDWQAFFDSAGLGRQASVIVWHPGAMVGAAALAGSADLATWRDYLAFHTINHFSDVLPGAFASEHFAFYGRTLHDTPQQLPRWKRALEATSAAMPEPVGHLYVDHYFPAQDKVRVQRMVSNIISAFSSRIAQLQWMAPATRAQAQEKLKTLYVGVAYPDHWQSFDGLQVLPGDALGNSMRAEAFRYARQVAKLHARVDPTDWSMPPQLVNAVNMPLQNAINFPAAILQPPFFDPAASDAVNYGSLGAIIGHEISHSFDDQGAQFDAQGRLRDWWQAADLAHFKSAAAALVRQYSGYRPYPDLALDGQLTVSENLADLAGLNAAYDAFRLTQHGAPAQPEADRAFFTGFAMAWRAKAREAAERQAILTDGHAPPRFRTATVRNIDAWYRAFDVQPGQALYLPPEQRVRVW